MTTNKTHLSIFNTVNRAILRDHLWHEHAWIHFDEINDDTELEIAWYDGDSQETTVIKNDRDSIFKFWCDIAKQYRGNTKPTTYQYVLESHLDDGTTLSRHASLDSVIDSVFDHYIRAEWYSGLDTFNQGKTFEIFWIDADDNFNGHQIDLQTDDVADALSTFFNELTATKHFQYEFKVVRLPA